MAIEAENKVLNGRGNGSDKGTVAGDVVTNDKPSDVMAIVDVAGQIAGNQKLEARQNRHDNLDSIGVRTNLQEALKRPDVVGTVLNVTLGEEDVAGVGTDGATSAKHATVAVVEHHKNAGQEPATVGSKLEATVDRHPFGIANHNATIGDTRLKDIPTSTDFARIYSATAGALKAAADRADTSNKPDMVQQQVGASGIVREMNDFQLVKEAADSKDKNQSPTGSRMGV
ncbi:hypothetical protein A4A49_39663 [Nicotiana attenuata]|uniref:Uncharacterized protein n=1 Tax=Nicotiana attenuata TaxID=49451 RepID=A0A1J6KUR8_NICAT|nr:hypothetical protein A4A49_39663 [Nicotiana attenuata]